MKSKPAADRHRLIVSVCNCCGTGTMAAPLKDDKSWITPNCTASCRQSRPYPRIRSQNCASAWMKRACWATWAREWCTLARIRFGPRKRAAWSKIWKRLWSWTHCCAHERIWPSDCDIYPQISIIQMHILRINGPNNWRTSWPERTSNETVWT